jgi:hypothetical protein
LNARFGLAKFDRPARVAILVPQISRLGLPVRRYPALFDCLLLVVRIALARRRNQAGIDDLTRHGNVTGLSQHGIELLEQSLDRPYSPRNRLLLALPPRSLKELIANLELIRCQSEEIILDADSSLDHIFFPETGAVSVVAVYADGNIIEMATIGREGCTGVLKSMPSLSRPLDSRAKCNRALREPDLHVFAELFENCLKRSLEAKAFSGRQIGGDDDVLDFLVGHFVDVDHIAQIGVRDAVGICDLAIKDLNIP